MPLIPPTAPSGELYQPFRPPSSPLPAKYRSLGIEERLDILRNRLGLWHDYAPLVSSLFRDGFSHPSIEEITGISGVEQNLISVASQGTTMTAISPSSSAPSSSPASTNGHPSNGIPRRSLGLLENARQRKGSFIQLFVMTGIFMLSLRSVGQKYRAQELEDLNSDLREERDSLSVRMDSVKSALFSEAALDPSGLLSSQLNRLFQDSSSSDR